MSLMNFSGYGQTSIGQRQKLYRNEKSDASPAKHCELPITNYELKMWISRYRVIRK